jgi:hypothetical protein
MKRGTKSSKPTTFRIGDQTFSVKQLEKADYGISTKDTFTLRSLFVSDNVETNIQSAQRYRHSDELVQQIIETKLDFLVAGFKNHAKNDKSRGFYDALNLANDFDQIITELADDLLTTDNAILHWKIGDEGELVYVMTLDPAFVKYSNALGQERMEIVLDPEVKKSILQANKEQQVRIPKKYRDAASMGRVELKNSDGEYWLVLTTGRRFKGLANPSMAAIFADIRLRNLFVDGDWATAFFAKAFIQLVKSGESIVNGPLAGSKRNWQTKKERTELNNLLKDVSKAMRIVGNHTLKVEHVIPPKEAYAEERYSPVETRIFRWGGIPKVIIEGQGGNYASGFIGKTKLIADMRRKRRMLASFIEKFYRHPTINTKEFDTDDIPKVRFNEQVLKDPKELIDELKLLLTHATGFSAETTLESLGYEPVTEWDRKRKEMNEDTKLMLMPMYEPSQGLLEGGRPPDAQTPTTPVSRSRTARTNADYSTDDFHHVDIPGVDGEIVGSKKLSNGVVIRFAKQANGKTAAKIILVPKSMHKKLSDAKKYVMRSYAEAELEPEDEFDGVAEE